MAETLRWWLVLEGVGLLALPIALVLFERLPGRGYAFAKPLGLLAGGYLFWLALSLHILPNRPGSIVWAFLPIAIISGLIVRQRGEELLRALGGRAGYIVAVEVLFTLALFTAAHLRSFLPEIAGTEKPMDFMLLNAASRSTYYTPDDAWFSGHGVSYYYFGYVIQAMVAKLAAQPTAIAFNLALAGTAALVASVAFGLGYEIARLVKSASTRAALAVGGIAVVLVLLLGNLEGAVEFGVANGAVSGETASKLDVANLETAQKSRDCIIGFPTCIEYPSDNTSFWWWWRATRISPDANSITEFPFFSFLLGDLHPHVMAIPYVLTVVALGLTFWRSAEPLSLLTWQRRPWLLLVSALLLGGLGFLNTWDLPTFGFVLALLVLARNAFAAFSDGPHAPETLRLRLFAASADGVVFLLPLILLAVLLYAPFYLSFSTQASGLATVRDGATRPVHSFLFWGPLVAANLPLPLLLLWRDKAARSAQRLRRAALLPAGLLGLWALLVLTLHGPGNLVSAVWDRGLNWLTLLFFAAGLVAALLALLRSLERAAVLPSGAVAMRRELAGVLEGEGGLPADYEPAEAAAPAFSPNLARLDQGEAAGAWRFDSLEAVTAALALMATAMLLIFGAEIFYIQDVFASRLNTVFKLSYQAWLLLGISGSFSLFWLWQLRRQAAAASLVRARRLALGTAAVLVAAALLYPLSATLSRTHGLTSANRTLDGLAFARNESPDDYAAVDWLRRRAGPGERIVEAIGGQYSGAARVSARTGIPTVLGWPGHEVQWGRGGAGINQRQEDVNRAFTTESLAEAEQILRQYGVNYVFIGSVELATYPLGGLAKFSALPVAFQSGVTTIYRLPPEQGQSLGGGE